MGGANTGVLANKVVACVTPAIFVIFVVFRGLRRKTLDLVDRMPVRHFHRFRQNSLFSVGGKDSVWQNIVLMTTGGFGKCALVPVFWVQEYEKAWFCSVSLACTRLLLHFLFAYVLVKALVLRKTLYPPFVFLGWGGGEGGGGVGPNPVS